MTEDLSLLLEIKLDPRLRGGDKNKNEIITSQLRWQVYIPIYYLSQKKRGHKSIAPQNIICQPSYLIIVPIRDHLTRSGR